VQFDLTVGTAIKVASKITNPEKTRQARYRITVKDGDPAKIIPSDSRQTIAADGSSRSAILEVKSLGPLDGQSGPADVDPRYSSSNALVTSSDSRVQRLAEQATRGVVDPWEKSLRIARWVHKNITDKNFTVGFAAASEVARNLSGDCTEHAVLTAAMCRAAGIPANVVIGLVYEPEHLRGFGYHMWNEVYVNQRWVAVDSSWDQSAVDAVHIKLTESSLDGVSPFEAFLPVVRVMGKMEIEPIEVR
jgi:transglutaminase-like putative cysteine protease